MGFFTLIFVLSVLILSLGCVLWYQVSHFQGEYSHNRKQQVIMVLGAALQKNRPGPALTERLEYALRLYRQDLATFILCTGGSKNRQTSEGKVMKEYLVQKGVPEESIWVEDQSVDTAENLFYSLQILARHNVGNQVYLVTHDYHMYRALCYARRLNFHPTPAPFRTRTLWMPYHKFRECLALMKCLLYTGHRFKREE
ncbi:YdcF family protein [Kroppenstedtia pulmonis]|uniref:YdcF family protein n=1 Tax=Kroppenstedtia pulmonis TaxID=1380685 RepID=A0A7D4C501_9BACL|nr:YdcF family protein [Kroppenstedtia pulmonis]QKG83536.1 YdcF family protein [Kroppenstedtia pulmonis]